MKKPLVIFAGFAMVTACSIAAILTAQERSKGSVERLSQSLPEQSGQSLDSVERLSQSLSEELSQSPLERLGQSLDTDLPPRALGLPTLPTTDLAVVNSSPLMLTLPGLARSMEFPVNENVVAVQQAQQALAAATTDEDRAAAQIKLRDALSAQFDSDMQRREEELESIRKRVNEMTALLEKRAAAKEEIVELRLQVIAQDANGLGWTDSSDGWLNRVGGRAILPPAGGVSISGSEAGVMTIRGTKQEVDRASNVIEKVMKQPSSGYPRPGAVPTLPVESSDFEVIQLQKLDPQLAIAAIKKFFGSTDSADADSGAPVIDGDMVARQVWVKGSKTQILRIRNWIDKLEENAALGHLPAGK